VGCAFQPFRINGLELVSPEGIDAVKPSAKREGAPLNPPSTTIEREPKV
jgi:hypothetical protein